MAISNGTPSSGPQPALKPSDLPSASDPDLVLEPATSAEYEQTWHLNSTEWKGNLTYAQYFERERYLLTSTQTRDGQATAWILTSSRLPTSADGTRPILAACETFLKRGIVARNGTSRYVNTHAIGSVFCRVEYRGRGYAGRMMAELGKTMETWQQEKNERATFSVLYSDIGKKFYNTFGWKPFPSTHISLSTVDQSEHQAVKERLSRSNTVGPASGTKDLETVDLESLPVTSYVEAEVKARSAQLKDVPHVTILPNMAHFRWHHMREEFICEALNLSNPKVKGAVHQPTGIALIWARVYGSDPNEWHLNILHVAVPPKYKPEDGAKIDSEAEAAITSLLLRAQYEAHLAQMVAGVELWDPSAIVISAAQKLKRTESDKIEVISRDTNHICSLKWMGAQDHDAKDGQVVWVANEKFAWC